MLRFLLIMVRTLEYYLRLWRFSRRHVSAEINWDKSKVSWARQGQVEGRPHLSGNLRWDREGLMALSIFLGRRETKLGGCSRERVYETVSMEMVATSAARTREEFWLPIN